MRSINFGKIKDIRLTKDPRFFELYIQVFKWYFELIL